MTENGQIIHQLATLTEGVRGLSETVKELKIELASERQNAQQSRARLYNRMDEMGRQHVKVHDDVSGLKEEIAAVDKKIGEVKTVTDKVTRWQLMAAGMMIAFSALVAILGGFVATQWHKFWAGIAGT